MKPNPKHALSILIIFSLVLLLSLYGFTQNDNQITQYPNPTSGCLSSGCHSGIEPIREHHSDMAQAIYKKGNRRGDPNGCTVCHNGDASQTTNKDLAHKDLIRFPGSMWLEDKTCGQCHEKYNYMLHRNLMQSEAGKIQGALWGWGAQTGYKRVYGNYDIKDTDGTRPMIGTEVYKDYMDALIAKHPDNFPTELKKLPEVDMLTIEKHPEQAVLTYLRSDCQRCHVGVRGTQRRGDFRGLGCASCHIPYSDEGYYEGKDPSIPKDKKGHILVHSIQSSRKAKVTVNNKSYSGIPPETCSSCHNRGKRIGVSFLGMIESPYDTPWQEDGSGQPKLHGKRYLYIRDDHHHDKESREGNPEGGMLCQDCHTTTSVHGNGNIGGCTFGEVEVECSDCHGTPDSYPWELPIGFGDEFGADPGDEPRGISIMLLDIQEKFNTVYDVEDGYLLSSRGNPFGNVIRRKDKVIVHSATGLDFEAPALKTINNNNSWKNKEKAHTAMVRVQNHVETMECYSCHTTWAPQCYGCHVKVDYSRGQRSTDWINTGNTHFDNGETVETMLNKVMDQPGKAIEGRTYLRWEDPILGINGEGRIGTLITGCQQITTVIGPDGNTLVSNKVWRTPAGMENSGQEGQRGIDMTPAQPHTVSRTARDCVSCHANPKTLGYGIHDGQYMEGYDKDRYMDLRTADGEVISGQSTLQFTATPDLPFDLSKIVTRDGKQLVTVGHHWPLSGPLAQQTREKMERVGTCVACHQHIPDGDVFVKAITTAGDVAGLTPHSDKEHSKLLSRDIRLVVYFQIFIPIAVMLFIFFLLIKRRRS